MEKEIEEEMNEMEEEDGNETYSAVEYHESNQVCCMPIYNGLSLNAILLLYFLLHC